MAAAAQLAHIAGLARAVCSALGSFAEPVALADRLVVALPDYKAGLDGGAPMVRFAELALVDYGGWGVEPQIGPLGVAVETAEPSLELRGLEAPPELAKPPEWVGYAVPPYQASKGRLLASDLMVLVHSFSIPTSDCRPLWLPKS